jgi:hypothetical protein
MATNRLGAGTANLSFNAPKSWRGFLGRLAFKHDVSMGELLRRMAARANHVLVAARDAATAEQSDIEAAALIRKAISDGITEADRPAIERALALILKSAEVDHALATNLNLQPEAKQ